MSQNGDKEKNVRAVLALVGSLLVGAGGGYLAPRGDAQQGPSAAELTEVKVAIAKMEVRQDQEKAQREIIARLDSLLSRPSCEGRR